MEDIQTGGVRRLTAALGAEGSARPGDSGGLEGLVLADRAAADLVGGARIRAEELLRRAEAEADEIREDARRLGLEQGRREGLEQRLEGVREMTEKMRRWRDEIRERDSSRWTEVEEGLTEMVLQITEKILRTELGDPETALALVRECLSRFSDLSDITLEVSPADMGTVLQRREELEREIPPRTELLLLTDESLREGEFRARGDEGVFEGTVADLIASLRRRFGEELAGEDSDII